MKTRLVVALLLLSITAACALPQAAPNNPPTQTKVSQNDIATQIAKVLTSGPTQMNTPVVIPTQPAPVVTATSARPPVTEPAPTVAPTNTPENTPTSTGTATPLPTNTIPATDPRQSLGNPTWTDNFSNDNNWPMGDDKFTQWEVKNNQLVIKPLDTLDGWRLTWPELKDFYLEMTAKAESCSNADHFGLIFHVPDKKAADRGYLYGISCDGKYALRTWNAKKMGILVKWTANPAILSGANQVNRIGVMAIGNQIRLYANGVLLKEIQDDTYTEGGFGIFIGSQKPEQMTLMVQDIRYWNNPK